MESKTSSAPLSPKDFASSNDVKWCPGCGDYSILKQVQSVLAERGANPAKTVFVSGIGCSSRFPYYMNTYGLHTVHGRPIPVATGLKLANPELDVWVITGDGDGLSIGGNHFIHGLRRNPGLKILLFNNQIYGLTKGQYSPTSERTKVTRSSPYGSPEHPVNPAALALGAEGTFIARCIDRDPVQMRALLHRASHHKGTAFVEIYQNCHVFNDGAFDLYSGKSTRYQNSLWLENGKALRFGTDKEWGIRLEGLKPEIVNLNEGFSQEDLWIHDEEDLTKANILARLRELPSGRDFPFPQPFGVLFSVLRPTFEEVIREQLDQAQFRKGSGELQSLLNGKQSWSIR